MAIDTREVIPSHVYVEFLVREIEGLVQVTVFDRVTTPAAEVAAAAVLAGGQVTLLAAASRSVPSAGRPI
jgi:hypothetical protein